MSRTTRFLKLFLPEDNDYYRVEEDQNENFEKIDKKLEEWDTGKESAIKQKKSGFNLDKTDSYEENNTNKLATARALYLLWEAFKAKIKAIKLTWEAIEDKPSTFPPDTHYHDDRYYTQTKSDNKLNGLAGKKDGTFPLSRAMRGNVYYLPSTNKYYFCKEDYDGYQISVPNSSFIEMSVYENLNRLNNLNRKIKVIFQGKPSEFQSKILQDSWEMLYISHSGDNTFNSGYYNGSFSIPRVNLEITGSLTIFEYFGGDNTDWFTLKYSKYSMKLSIENAHSSDNDVVISVL